MKQAPLVLTILLAACSFTPRPAPGANLNHFYLVVDESTAMAISTSDILGRLGSRRSDDPEEPGQDYAGHYLYGYQTYAEFFDPSGFDLSTDKPARIGLFGLAVGGDHLGDLDRVAHALDTKAISYERPVTTFTTRDTGEALPRFESISLEGASDQENYLWAMQYQREFIELIRDISDEPSIKNADPDSAARWMVNEWRYDPDLWLRDIVSITAIIDEETRSRFMPLLEASGFIITQRRSGFTARGNDIQLHFTVSDRAPFGIKNIGFTLTSAPEKPGVHAIGSSKLQLGPGPSAEWVF